MKGNCELVKCQICQQEMSFGRIKRHVSSHHNEITLEQYIQKYWQTLPLHNPCQICNKNTVYKYQTCSKECHSILKTKLLKGIPKPEGFMSKEHKNKISKSHIGKIVLEETGIKISQNSKGISRNKGKQPMLGKKQSEHQKQIASQNLKNYYNEGNKPWTYNNKHTYETVEKILKNTLIKNKSEKILSKLLDDNNIKHSFSFFIKESKNICKQYDFKLEGFPILIEMDGDYWHGNSNTTNHWKNVESVKQNDLIKDQLAKDNGYTLIRIWESDLKQNPIDVINKIKETINTCHHLKN